MPTPHRLALASTLIAGLLLAGCARHQTTKPQASATSSTATERSTGHPPHTQRTTRHAEATSDAGLPEQTGIPACDDYLSSYLACHRAAGIYSAEQLPLRYEAMRTNLLRDSQNPDVRPQLAERCNSLARSLREALHGKSCAADPAPAASSP